MVNETKLKNLNILAGIIHAIIGLVVFIFNL